MKKICFLIFIIIGALGIFLYRKSSELPPIEFERDILKSIPEVKIIPINPEIISGKIVSQIMVLDGSQSIRANKSQKIIFSWRQIRGPNLDIPAIDLTREKIALKIHQNGNYCFELVVIFGIQKSKPSLVEFSINNPFEKEGFF